MIPFTVSFAVAFTSGYPRFSNPAARLAAAINASYSRFARCSRASSRASFASRCSRNSFSFRTPYFASIFIRASSRIHISRAL